MPSERRIIDPFDPLARPDLDAAGPPPDPADRTSAAGDDDPLETRRMPPGSIHRRKGRNTTVEAFAGRWAADQLGRLPDEGEAFHLITNGRFDTFTLLPAMLDLAAPRVCELWYASTWIISRKHTLTLFDLIDAGKIRQAGIITGTYFKRRETAVFWQLVTGLRARRGLYRACLNHSKWMALGLDDGSGYVLTSSANFAENGNIENHTITRDRGLFDFYARFAASMLRPAGDEADAEGPAPARGRR